MHNEEYDDAITDFSIALVLAEGDGKERSLREIGEELKLAEAKLERWKRNYYKILRVPRDCNKVDIRSAYLRESPKHHPDKVRHYPFFLYSPHPVTPQLSILFFSNVVSVSLYGGPPIIVRVEMGPGLN